MQDLEQAIREHAYHLWAANGRHEGNAETFWLAAQREILATSAKTLKKNSVPRAKTEKKAQSRKGVRAA
jgi:dsDNA-binding SOS-regulon protein